MLILLAQTDGLVLDFTDPPFGFFYRGKDHNFEDDATVAGMPIVLRVVRRAVNRDVKRASMSDAFERNGILHGRNLGFGTQTNSTKAIALLGGVIEWLKPKAHAATERRQADLEARHAGSGERDADGRRLDRRGFVIRAGPFDGSPFGRPTNGATRARTAMISRRCFRRTSSG